METKQVKKTVNTAETIQVAIPELNKAAKKLYYLIIGDTPEERVVINIGEKTYIGVNKLIGKELEKEEKVIINK